MRVVLAVTGSRGDVQPMIALGLALKAAGHQAVLAAPANFEGWARQVGLEFHPTGGDFEAWLRVHAQDVSGNPLRMMRGMRDMLRDHAPQWFSGTIAAAEGAQVILGAALFAAPSVAEARGLPYFNVFYTPTLLASAHYPPLMVPWQRLPRWANRALWRLMISSAGHIFAESINQGRAELKLPRLKDVGRHVMNQPVLLAVDPEVAPLAPDWVQPPTCTGYWFYEDASPLPPEVEAFLAAGPPPVYVGFGSMMTRDPLGLTRTVLEGVKGTGHRLLLSAGWAGMGAGELPAGCKVIGPVAHAALFRRVAAVVHHGGSGTTANALRAGVPQVIVPHAVDQFYWGHRLQVMGLGPAAVPVARLTPERLTASLQAALGAGGEARQRIAERLQQSNGLAQAVSAIEARVLGRGGQV